MPEVELSAVPLDEYTALYDEYKEAVVLAAKWDERKKLLAEHLTKLIGEKDMGTIGGAGVVKVIRSSTGARVDTTRLHEKYPDVYREMLIEPKPRKPYLTLMS